MSDALDWLAGDPDQITAYAQTWRNVAANCTDVAADYQAAIASQISGWGGSSAEAYRQHASRHLTGMTAIGRAAGGMATLVEGAGLLVALVRELVRDLIADFVATLAVRLPEWLAEAGLTLGAATPLVISQVSSLVAKWAGRIAKLINALMSSLRRLTPMLGRLGGIIDEITDLLRRLARNDGVSTPERADAGRGTPSGTPDKPLSSKDVPDGADTSSMPDGAALSDFPRGSDFISDESGYSPEAAEAYERIRNSPDDTPRVAENAGLHPNVVEGMRQNLFVQQHNVAIGPNQTSRGYFTPDDRVAGLWDEASSGTISPQRRQELRMLAAHEYVENRLMEAGLPYRSAHPDAWDSDGALFTAAHPSAHNIAPNEWRPAAPLAHWRVLGLDSSGLELADDLSNLDQIVTAALRGLGL